MPFSLIALLVLLNLTQISDAALGVQVARFWSCVESGDKSGAAELVSQDGRESFVKRKLLPVTNWREVERRTLDDGRVEVVISARLQVPGAAAGVPFRARQIWILEAGEWRLEVPEGSAREVNRLLYGPRRE